MTKKCFVKYPFWLILGGSCVVFGIVSLMFAFSLEKDSVYYLTFKSVARVVHPYYPVTAKWIYENANIAVYTFFALIYFFAAYKAFLFSVSVFQHKYTNIKKWEDVEKLTPDEFEEFVAEIYRKQGLHAERVGFGANVEKGNLDGRYGDGGKDGVIYNWLGKPSVLIQCKKYKHPVGVKIIREMYAVVSHYKAKKMIIVTTSRFTRDAIDFAKGKPLVLVDKEKLLKLMKK